MKKQLALMVLSAMTAFSQTNTNSLFQVVKEVVVTATRLPQEHNSTTMWIDVLRPQSKGTPSLADALQSLTGLEALRSGTPGQNVSVFTRGLEGRHTLLLIDGRRQPVNLAGGFDYGNIALNNAESIEVVKGPLSVMYGPSAMAGTINVTSKRGSGLPSHSVEVSGGSFNTIQEKVASSGKVGKVDYSVGASKTDAEFSRPNSKYSLHDISALVGYNWSQKMRMDLKMDYSLSDAGIPGSTAFPSDVGRIVRSTFGVSPGLSVEHDNWLLKSYYSYNQQNQHFSDTFFDNDLDLVSHQFDSQLTHDLWGIWAMTGGIQLTDSGAIQKGHVSKIESIHANQTATGLFLQSQLNYWNSFALESAVRVDFNTDYASALTWRHGISWTASKALTFYANYGTAFTPPTFQDLYFPGFNNPDLKPESASSYEVGARWTLGSVSGTTALFRSEVSDLIQFQFPKPVNVAQATAQGLETKWTVPLFVSLDWQGGYTFTDATDGVGNRLLRRPAHSFRNVLNYRPADKWQVTLSATSVFDREDIDASTFSRVQGNDFTRVDATVSFKPSQRWELWMKTENLTDQKYSEASGFPANRIGAYVGAKLNF